MIRYRLNSLEFSQSKLLNSEHQGAILWLDLDHGEQRFLLSCAADGSISAFDTFEASDASGVHDPLFLVTKENNADAHKNSVSCVCWYPVDGGLFVSGSRDKKVNIWDANELRVAGDFDINAPVFVTAMSPIAKSHCLVGVGSDQKDVLLCDIVSGAGTHVLSGHQNAVWSLSWSLGCEYELATGSKDGQIRIWDIRQAAGALHVFDMQQTVSFDDSSDRNLTYQNSRLKSLKPNLGKHNRSDLHLQAHLQGVTGLLPTPDGLHWISAGNDDQIRLWDSSNYCNKLVNYPKAFNRAIKPRQLSISDCSQALFHPSGSSIQVFEICSGSEIARLTGGHFESINACLWNPSQQELYTGAGDCAIVVWSPNLLSHCCGGFIDSELKNMGTHYEFGGDNWTESDEDTRLGV